jgi:hypothetical protein
MGKRSDFPRRVHDAYFTPLKPVLKLLPHLPHRPFTFVEPCAGDGRLVRHLEEHSNGHCIDAFDIAPLDPRVIQRDAMDIEDMPGDFFITNPPWTRQILHPLIEHLSSMKPTWMLFDADWAHTRQAQPFLPYCQKIVAVGRVSWMENSKAGVDNSAWYLFGANNVHQTEFYGLAA